MPTKIRKQPEFIALDGEAINSQYVLLGTSIPGKTLENKNGIKTREALDFLWRLGSNRLLRARSAVFVSFYFTYDVEMIVRDLPKFKKILLFKTGKCDYAGYSLRYIKRKFFTVKRQGKEKLKCAKHDFDCKCKDRGYKVHQNGITVFDVCGFFIGQGGFIKVLQSFGIDVPPEIIEGKAARGGFTWENYAGIKEYNRIECKLLCELMNKVYDLCNRIGIVPRRWYGSSAIANLALRQWKIADYSRRTTVEWTPEPFFDAITRAYFGGRIEAFKLGSFENVFSYDINSAYPSAMIHLPKTKGNFWVRTNEYVKAFGLWRVKYKFPKTETIGLLPYRRKDGSIKFPLQGEGWFYEPEITLALERYPKSLKFIDGYILMDEDTYTPLREKIPTLYRQRQKYKAAGDLSQWVIKILLNSLYGKFAQKVGRADFKNFVYAGFTTSYTRAKLRAAVIGKENSVIAFNTDGIFSLEKLRLKDSRELGEWEFKKYSRASVIMSGLHLTEDAEGNRKVKNRGFPAFPEWNDILLELNKRKKIIVPINVFVGFLLAWNFPNEYGESYLKFVKKEKVVNPRNLTKRRYHLKEIKDWRTDFCTSSPIERLDGLSYPIKIAPELTEEDFYELMEDVDD